MFNKKILRGALLYSYALLLTLPLACSKASAEGIALQGMAKQSYMARYLYKEYVKTPERPAFSAPKGWTYDVYTIEGVPMERLATKKKRGANVVLQLHGGAYLWGLTDWYRQFAVKQAELTEASEVYLVDYRLAPDYKYPAALEDAVTAYQHILDMGISAKNIIVMGDSAGANLALALALYLREHKMPLPQSLVLMSPWTTMKENLPSRYANYKHDLILGELGADAQKLQSKLTYGEGAEANPYVSPLYADLTALPPMLIQTGSYDMLLDDARFLAEVAKKYKVPCQYTVYPEVPHVFQVMLPTLKESEDAYKEIAEFVKKNK